MPERKRGVELLDDPAVAPAVRERSHRDIVRTNVLFGGCRAALLALQPFFDERLLPPGTTGLSLLDVGTGLGDIPWRARELASRRGLRLDTIGLDGAATLVAAARGKLDAVVCGDALTLPLASRSVDVVLCSQLLHHFERDDAIRLIGELHRVARVGVVISDLRRSWLAAVGFWAVSFALRFEPITRHDGTTSVLRGFTDAELGGMVLSATGVPPVIRRRLGYRLTASWAPLP